MAEDVGVDKEIIDSTPVLSTFMGYSMCGGFYPALVVIMTLIQPESSNEIAWLILLLMIPLIMVSTLGMTGVPGADVAVILTILSVLGLGTAPFASVYLVEGLLDKFRGVGNSMGFIAATSITNKINNKYFKKKEEN